MFRIQKMLLSEFREIYEPIMVENPFTQVDADGRGLRQYQIGLTTSKIIFGCDDFNAVTINDCGYHVIDPEIETFQLVSLLPLQFIHIQFYRRRGRDIMQITVNGDETKPMFFEIGGHYHRTLFWETWRERIATIRLQHPLFFHISGSSPFSSTDVLADDELCEVMVHPEPQRSITSYCISCSSSI